MKLLLCPHVERPQNSFLAQQFALRLRESGVECFADDPLRALLGNADSITFLPKQKAEEACDMLVAIGGDGTMLRVAQRAIRMDKPVFGINTGRVGFLSAFDGNAALEITLKDIENLKQSNRQLLDFSLKSAPNTHRYAINDVVIQRSPSNNTIEVSIEYGKYTVGTIRADGMIVSTPTGSTAYSLSAGGPVVGPAVEAFVITPICAHNLAARSFVLGSGDVVQISPVERADNTALISIDGVPLGSVHPGDTVEIKLGDKSLKLLTSEKRNFYGILNREFSERD